MVGMERKGVGWGDAIEGIYEMNHNIFIYPCNGGYHS